MFHDLHISPSMVPYKGALYRKFPKPALAEKGPKS